MNIAESLAATPVADLDLTRFVTVSPETTVAATVDTMNASERTLACVVSEEKLIGVFTQRDYLMRVIGRSHTWDDAISAQMTRSVRSMALDQSAADGLAIMNDWWVRSVPVLAPDGSLAGNLSYYEVMAKIASLVSERLKSTASDPAMTHSLTLIDFTGLHTNVAVTVKVGDTVETAAHHMRARAIGSVLVVDEHEQLVGMLTEYDLQKEIACEIEDLAKVAVEDIMTPDPISLAMRSPIMDAVEQMASRGFSHLPLLGESGKPVAVASFRDIAGYMESSFAALS